MGVAMLFRRDPGARRAAVALAVLLLHVALVWLFVLSGGIRRRLEDHPGAMEALLLPEHPASPPGYTKPHIKPDLRVRVPDVLIPESALEEPVKVAVEVPADRSRSTRARA